MISFNIVTLVLGLFSTFKLVQYGLFEIKENKNKVGGRALLVFALFLIPAYFFILCLKTQYA